MVQSERELFFVDTNVLMDFIQIRHPFFEEANMILEMATKKSINIAISTLSFSTFLYLCRKTHSKEILQGISKEIRRLSKVLPMKEESIIHAEETKFSDLEDAIQNHIAESNGCTSIITRNKRDFKKSNLIVLTPGEFLATRQQ